MSPASLSERAQRVVEAILAINDRTLERTWIGDGETTLFDMATGEVVTGPHDWYAYLQEWYRGFPDGRVDVVNVVDGGDHVAVEYTGTGTHLGTYYGMTPTGRRSTSRMTSAVMAPPGFSSMRRTALATSASGSMVRGVRDMTSRAASFQGSGCFIRMRLKSPSVITPASRPSARFVLKTCAVSGPFVRTGG